VRSTAFSAKEISTLEISRILTRLGFTVLPGGEDTYLVHIPSWRLDIEREIDIIEELARLHGYDKFPTRFPRTAVKSAISPMRTKRRVCAHRSWRSVTTKPFR